MSRPGAQPEAAGVSRFTLPDDERRGSGGSGLKRPFSTTPSAGEDIPGAGGSGNPVRPRTAKWRIQPTPTDREPDAARAEAAGEGEAHGHWRPRLMRAGIPQRYSLPQ